jgi:hypothetical protein
MPLVGKAGSHLVCTKRGLSCAGYSLAMRLNELEKWPARGADGGVRRKKTTTSHSRCADAANRVDDIQ